MKELSIEEKAKRYDEAIEKAKEMIKSMTNIGGVANVADIQYLFPELKESEDKKIKSDIQYAVRCAYGDNSSKTESVLAWLEKQGEQKPAWTPMDEQRVENLLAIIEGHGYPGEVAWLNSLKDRVQPKQEWSEEDEQLYNDLSDTYFYNDEDYPEETYKLMLKRVLDWMNKRAKSLKPQSQWKPSDEQLDALYDVLNPCDGVDKKALESLYEQLKAL